MRILLDECVDQRLRLLFIGHDCRTAGYAKLSGLKNGELLTAAEAAGFEALVTTDRDIPHQQKCHNAPDFNRHPVRVYEPPRRSGHLDARHSSGTGCTHTGTGLRID